jgi:uncharacterized damage-inducible protein DinB
MSPFATEFCQQTVYFLELNPPRIANCLGRLTELQVWQKPNSQTNSIGNLILHLCGNIRQYAVSSLGGLPDVRVRDEEFSITGGPTKAALLTQLEETVAEAVKTINACSETELMRKRSVQGFTYTGIGILVHLTEHFSYHVGQVALYTKLLKDEDLGFYEDVDLNVTGK